MNTPANMTEEFVFKTLHKSDLKVLKVMTNYFLYFIETNCLPVLLPLDVLALIFNGLACSIFYRTRV